MWLKNRAAFGCAYGASVTHRILQPLATKAWLLPGKLWSHKLCFSSSFVLWSFKHNCVFHYSREHSDHLPLTDNSFHIIHDKTKTNKAMELIGYALESWDWQLFNPYPIISIAEDLINIDLGSSAMLWTISICLRPTFTYGDKATRLLKPLAIASGTNSTSSFIFLLMMYETIHI